jgi:hypothetical protein
MTFFLRSLLAAALLLPAVTSLAASLDEPFATANRQPFVQIYGLPDAEGAAIQAPKQSLLVSSLDVANTFSASFDSQRAVYLDGESYRANFKWRYGLNEKWEVGADLPFWMHDGGFMDRSIETFHDVFDLDNGNREDFGRNDLRYRYLDMNTNQVIYSLDEQTEGVGDIRFATAYQLQNENSQQLALRGSLKLPTGDAEKLTGSESVDIALAIHYSDQQWLDNDRLAFHANGGMLWMDGTDVIAEEHNSVVWYGSSTVSWRWRDSISWKLQLDAQSAFYDSPLEELGDPALQLILGGSFRSSEKFAIDVSFTEDLIVNTSPDVVLQIALRVQL